MCLVVVKEDKSSSKYACECSAPCGKSGCCGLHASTTCDAGKGFEWVEVVVDDFWFSI
jgi:hypothetical protein